MAKRVRNRVTFSITVSPEIFEYIEKECKRTGLNRSALLTVALDMYRNQTNVMRNFDNFEKLIAEVRKMKEEEEMKKRGDKLDGT